MTCECSIVEIRILLKFFKGSREEGLGEGDVELV